MALAGALIAKVALEGIDGVTKGLQQMGKDMQATGKNVGANSNNMAKTVSTSMGNMVKAIGLVKVAQWGLKTAMGQLNSAISRFDTLNNFPKVLQQMGFSAEEAEWSMNRLGDGISGLPTALDSIASATKQMTIVLRDVEQGTDLTLALNNAFLASGASSADAALGIDAYTRMLARGTVDGTTWNTLVSNMPYGLDQVAQSLLGAEANQSTLLTAMQKGTITIDELNAEFIKLDQQVDGFADTARTATGGIGTAWANMQTMFTRNVEKIIRAFDESLPQSIGGIEGIIKKVSDTFNNFFAGVIDAIPPVIDRIITMYNHLDDHGVFEAIKNIAVTTFEKVTEAVGWVVDKFDELLPVIMDIAVSAFESLKEAIGWVIDNANILLPIIGGLTGAFVAYNVVLTVTKTLSAIASTFGKIKVAIATYHGAVKGATVAQTLLNMVLLANPFVVIIVAVAGLVAALVILWNTNEGFRDFILGAWDAIKTAIKNTVKFIVDFIKNNWEILLVIFTGGFGAIILLVVKNWDTIKDATKALVEKLINFWESFKAKVSNIITAISDFFSKAWNKIKEVAKVVFDSILNGWDSFKTSFQNNVTAVTDFFKAKWDSLTTAVSEIFDSIKDVIDKAWDVIKTIFLIAIGVVITLLTPLWNAFADGWNWVVDMVTAFVATVKTFISNLVDTLTGYWENFKNNVKAIWDFIRDNVITPVVAVIKNLINSLLTKAKEVMEGIKAAFSVAWDFIRDNVITPVVAVIKNLINSLLTKAKEVMDGIREAFSVAWNFIRDNIITPVITIIKSIIESVRNTVQSVLDTVRNTWTTVFNGIKETVQAIIDSIKNKINEVKTKVSEVIEGVKNTFSAGFNAVKDTVSSAVESVKETINGIWISAKEVTGKIKDAFSNIFKSIKVPSFSMGGWTAKDLPKMPKMSVQWNATGGFLDKATLIGAGEAGTEAIVPMSGKRKMAPFAKAITDNFDFGNKSGGGSSGETVTQHFNIAELVVREDADIYRIAQELHKLQERNSSRNGVFR